MKDTDGVNYGPEANRHRIEREARPDGPNQTVLGGRRKDGLRTMFRRGNVTVAQWDAAEKYRNDLSRASGASDAEAGMKVTGSAHSYGPTERQIDAQTRINAANRRITLPLQKSAALQIVIGGQSIAAFAKAERIGEKRASQALNVVLDNLTDFYDSQPAES